MKKASVETLDYVSNSRKIIIIFLLYMIVFSGIVFLLSGEKFFRYFFKTDRMYFFISRGDFINSYIVCPDSLVEFVDKILNANNTLLRQSVEIALNNLFVVLVGIFLYPTLIFPIIDLLKYSFLLGFQMKLQFLDVNSVYRNVWMKIFDLSEVFTEITFYVIWAALATSAAFSFIFKYRENVDKPRKDILIRHYVYLLKVCVLCLPMIVVLAVWEAFAMGSYK